MYADLFLFGTGPIVWFIAIALVLTAWDYFDKGGW